MNNPKFTNQERVMLDNFEKATGEVLMPNEMDTAIAFFRMGQLNSKKDMCRCGATNIDHNGNCFDCNDAYVN